MQTKTVCSIQVKTLTVTALLDGARSHPSFLALSERDFNYSAEASQYDFGDINNNVNSEIGVPLVATSAPTSLSWEPGRQLIRLNWIAPETNSSTGVIGGYQIKVQYKGLVYEFPYWIDNNSI